MLSGLCIICSKIPDDPPDSILVGDIVASEEVVRHLAVNFDADVPRVDTPFQDAGLKNNQWKRRLEPTNGSLLPHFEQLRGCHTVDSNLNKFK